MIFKVANLFKNYHRQKVIERFSYEFHEGLYLLIGSNGIGKSTLLKMFAEVIHPTNDNYDMSSIRKAYLCERVALSNGRPKSYLKDLMKLNHANYDLDELLQKWQIKNTLMRKLSKGNRQKIGILSMIITGSELYLFDEPTDALDLFSKKLFIELIEELKKDKIVIIATHEKQYFEGLDYVEINLD